MKVMKTADAATTAMRVLRDRIPVSYCITVYSRGCFRDEFDNDWRASHDAVKNVQKDTGKVARHFDYSHSGVAGAGTGPNFREIGLGKNHHGGLDSIRRVDAAVFKQHATKAARCRALRRAAGLRLS